MSLVNWFSEYECRKCGMVQFEEVDDLVKDAIMCKECSFGIACMTLLHSNKFTDREKPKMIRTYDDIKNYRRNYSFRYQAKEIEAPIFKYKRII